MAGAVELLGKVGGCAVNPGVVVGGGGAVSDGIARGELGALLAGLDDFEMDLALAKYAGCFSSRASLVARCRVLVDGVAKRERWRRVDGRPCLDLLAVEAVGFVLDAKDCAVCDGVGFVRPAEACPVCDGIGVVGKSGREMARRFDVSLGSWNGTWSHRFFEIVRMLQGIDLNIKSYVFANNRSGIVKNNACKLDH